jgi:hypothetical protein
MEQIVKHKDRVIEQLLSISAEMSTFAKRGEWDRLDRLAAERVEIVQQLTQLESTLKNPSAADQKRWSDQIRSIEKFDEEVTGWVRKFQNHIQTELKGLSDQKALLISAAQINPSGQRISTTG